MKKVKLCIVVVLVLSLAAGVCGCSRNSGDGNSAGSVNRELSAESEGGGSEETDVSGSGNDASQSVFSAIPEEFVFSSGAGGWQTVINIEPDGSFAGEYADSDMGTTGADYPNGTTYICSFKGKFVMPEKIDQYTYSTRLEEMCHAFL